MIDAKTYEAAVRDACLAAVVLGATSWGDILHASFGADPLVVFAALATLHTSGDLDDEVWNDLRQVAQTRASAPPATDRPIPHPLDYVWRFDERTIKRLLEHVMATTARGDTAVYLGTPMLHAAALRVDGGRNHVLLDHDPRVVEETNNAQVDSAVCIDLLEEELPELVARVVVADPPWYPDECSVFVNAAARLLDGGGRVLVAFGSPLTRPSAVDDFEVVVATAAEDGLALRSVQDGACGYVSPPFERASLEIAGLPGVPEDWRRGQLLEFERVSRHRPPRRTMQPEEWWRIDIDEIPLRVRPTAPVVGADLISTIVRADQLVSVSRREGVREQVALWTSRNRVYGSRDPARLAAILRQMQTSATATLAGEERGVADRIEQLVKLERLEHGLVREEATP